MLTDRRRVISSVNAVQCAAEVKSPRTKGVAGAAGNKTRKIGLSGKHLGRRKPVRPFHLARDCSHTLPGKPLTADANSVSNGFVSTEYEVQMSACGIDDDCSGLLVTRIVDDLTPQIRG